MNKFLHALAAVAMTAACGTPAFAEQSGPTVRQGEFHCFPGMPASEINYLPAAPEASHKMLRGPKIGNSKFDNADGHDLREVTTQGDYRALVILVNFKDVAFTQRKDDPRSLVDEMLNSPDFTFQGATGSANAFFRESSKGQFNPIFDVYGPIDISKTEAEYSGNTNGETYIDAETGVEVSCYPAGFMVDEAIRGLDDQIDYSKYDSDGDGYVDFVYIFHAGKGATTGGSTTRTIWPHAFTLRAAIGAPVELDGVKINRYATSSELGRDNKLSGIGTFCHEFTHVLGLPDLYDTANNTGRPSDCFTPGTFSFMDGGNYNNNEHTPVSFSAYERYALEWMKPTEITAGGNFTLLPLESRPFAYKIPSTFNPQEYFLIENRAKTYYDQFIEGFGLIVWHIDFNLKIWDENTVNNNASHQRIDIIEADDHKNTSSRSADTFPGSGGKCEFMSNVSPAFKDWSGKSVGYDLVNIITHFDGTTSFTAKAANGTVMEGSELNPAAPYTVAASVNSISVEWPAVEGAIGYYASVFNAEGFDGRNLEYGDYVPGYIFLPLADLDLGNSVCNATFEGLEPNREYGIMIYAVNDLNASRMTYPLIASTVDGSDFENARANIYLYKVENDTILMEWDAVEGADDYQISVVTRAPGNATTSLEADFTGNQLPEDWSGNGKYDSGSRYVGNAAPSYRLDQSGAYLCSPIYEEQIKSLSFWGKKRYADEGTELNVLVADKDGRWRPAQTLTGFTTSGEIINIELPANAYGVKLIYNFSVTDLNFYIDDMKVTFCADAMETPADAEISRESETSALVKGLENGKEYVAYVTPTKSSADGKRSNEIAFRLEDVNVSGVEEIIASGDAATFRIEGMTVIPSDPEAAYSISSIDGISVAAAAKGSFTLPARGIYIISVNGSAIKVRI